MGAATGALPDVLPCRETSLKTAAPAAAFFRCVTGPSDILYLPDGWAHATCGLSHFNVGIGFIGSIAALPKLHQAAVRGEMVAMAGNEGYLEPAGQGMLNEGGLLPFHWAAWNGHLRLSKRLLHEELQQRFAVREASLEATTSIAHALRWAAARGHRSVTGFLVKQIGPEVKDEQGHFGRVGIG